MEQSEVSSDLIESILNTTVIITNDQWKDMHKSRNYDPVYLLWLAVLRQTITDWKYYKEHLNSHIAHILSQDIQEWIKDSDTFLIAVDVIAQQNHIDSDLFAEAFRTYIGEDPNKNIVLSPILLEVVA